MATSRFRDDIRDRAAAAVEKTGAADLVAAFAEAFGEQGPGQFREAQEH